MFEEVLPAGTKRTLALLEKNQAIKTFCLAGGTGLALQLGHRISCDLDLSGGLRLGSDDNYLSDRTKDYSVDENIRKEFFLSVSRFMPFIEEDDIAPDFSGIRSKLQPECGEFRDFVIREEIDEGLLGFVNLTGIEPPG